MSRWLSRVAGALMAFALTPLLPSSAFAQAAPADLSGIWTGHQSGNQVRMVAVQGGYEATAVTSNAYQSQAPMVFSRTGQDEYSYTQGGVAVFRLIGQGVADFRMSSGFSDTFYWTPGSGPTGTMTPPGAVAAAAPPPPVRPALPSVYQPSPEESDQIALLDRALAAPVPLPPKPKPPVSLAPTFDVPMNSGLGCVEFKKTAQYLGYDGNGVPDYWHTDFEVRNNCADSVLVQWEFATSDAVDNPQGAPIQTNTLPIIIGATWVNWNHQEDPKIGFTPRNRAGEGIHMERTGYFTGSELRPVSAPQGAYTVWMFSCPAYAPFPIAQSLFQSDADLRHGAKVACVPNIKWP